MRSKFYLILILTFTQIGCGLLIGNIKPVDEKSENYGVSDLSKSNTDWVRINSTETTGASKSNNTSEIADVAYQSKKTASIISLNSACRTANINSEHGLQEFSKQLLMGITDIKFKNEKNIIIQEQPALQTTVQGKLGGEQVKLKTVVMRQKDCIYDLTYIARPEHFSEQEVEFDDFVLSLRIK